MTEIRHYESGIMSNRKSLRFGELSTEIAYTPPVTPRELGLALSLVDPAWFILHKSSNNTCESRIGNWGEVVTW